MRIVVLDGLTLNPGDLSWEGLEALGALTVYDRTPPDQVIPRAAAAEVALTNKTVLTSAMIEQLTQLAYIGVLATGYNIVDVDAAARRRIPVTNVPAYSTHSVAQMVFAHLLNLTQNVAGHTQSARSGKWAACEDFCYWDTPLIELAGLTMGIVGFGRIGQTTAKVARAFGMTVIAHDPVAPESMPEGCALVSLDEVFRSSDVISLHCPLTLQTERLVNADRLATMKSTAVLINTSRGPLVDEQALADALNRGAIAGAGVDVLCTEPPASDNPLLQAKNCSVTPHIAWATRAARQRLLATAVDNVAAFAAGSLQNVVNDVTRDTRQ